MSGRGKLKPPIGYLVAGTHSGVGKTTVTLALLRAIRISKRSVQPFKIGPDFIDPAYHEEAADKKSINLDLWMMGERRVQAAYRQFAEDADIALIESMGALFDGENGTERGSAAHLAKLLRVPIILVIDIWGMTRSTTPLLNGFFSFDPRLEFAGFVLNRAGSERHAQMVYDSLPHRLRQKSLGHIIQNAALKIEERHLGLLTVEENEQSRDSRLAALDIAQSDLRIDRLLPKAAPKSCTPRAPRWVRHRHPVRIAVARDPAFCFYYFANLAALEKAGAQLCSFSPIADPTLPPDIAGVYIGGGYPESFHRRLAANEELKQQLRLLADRRMPIYAECGGLMYLGRTLTSGGSSERMVGVFPVDTVMDPKYLAIRYVSVRTLVRSPLGPPGIRARGQEFHQSRIVEQVPAPAIYRVTSSTGERYEEGLLVSRSAIGSYIHLHFSSNPNIPRNFVESCRAWYRKEAS